MKKLLALTATMAIGLLAGSAVGVAAQDDEAAAPVEFTAKLAFGPSVRSETSTVGDGVTTHSGGAWRAGVITQASDPRLQGTTYMAANSNDYSAAGGPIVWNYAFRIVNDGGAWQQRPTLDLDFSDGVGRPHARGHGGRRRVRRTHRGLPERDLEQQLGPARLHHRRRADASTGALRSRVGSPGSRCPPPAGFVAPAETLGHPPSIYLLWRP